VNRIVTFYSYKGGVGRTLALANIGVLLAMRGKRVLLMDWDLEAPGLDRYFSSYLPNGFASDRGTIQLLYEARTNANADWHPHVQQITVQADDASTPATYTLSVIPSGVGSPDYARKVQTLSWANFLRKKDGGRLSSVGGRNGKMNSTMFCSILVLALPIRGEYAQC
jgi:cellulose biosynthesis protein BcsQ